MVSLIFIRKDIAMRKTNYTVSIDKLRVCLNALTDIYNYLKDHYPSQKKHSEPSLVNTSSFFFSEPSLVNNLFLTKEEFLCTHTILLLQIRHNRTAAEAER